MRAVGSGILAIGLVAGVAFAPAAVATDPPIDDATRRAREVEVIRDQIARDAWRLALERSEAAAARWPDDVDVRTARAEALWRAGEIERARILAEEVAGGPNPPARALVSHGLALAARGEFGAAVDRMRRARERAPRDPHVAYWAAGFQATREDAIEALEHFLSVADGDDPDRIEGARGTMRLYRALGDRDVWVPRTRPPTDAIPLDRVRGLDGRVDGFGVDVVLGERKRPVRLLFDTGSPGLFLVDKVARKRGLEPLSEEITFGGGGSGRHRSRRGVLSSLRVGGLVFDDVLATTTDSAIDDFGRYKGLLGLHAFDGYRVTLDLQEGTLRLGPSPSVPEPGGDDYWVIAGQMLVRAAAADGPAGLFLLDTGASRTLLDLDFAERIGPAAVLGKTRVQSYGGLREGAREVEGAVVTFQDHRTRGRRVNAVDLTQRSRLSGVQISGFLGLDLLVGRVVVIDTVHRKVWIREPDGEP